MKKKLEADLISIAHRILKLKNRSELEQLHQETQKLYEKLSVLRFVEDNFSDVKPTIGLATMENLVTLAFEKQDSSTDDSILLASAETDSEVISLKMPEKNKIVVEDEIIDSALNVEASDDFMVTTDNKEDLEPHIDLFKEEKAPIKKPKKESKQISLEDILGLNLDPIFERVQSIDVSVDIAPEVESELKSEDFSETKEEFFSPAFEISDSEEVEKVEVVRLFEDFDDKKANLINSSSRLISFGLNDKIAFEKHLFDGSSEDLNRVISQLSTFDTFDEAENFIEDMVKPDYNNWEGKDDYVARFMEIVEKKFA